MLLDVLYLEILEVSIILQALKYGMLVIFLHYLICAKLQEYFNSLVQTTILNNSENEVLDNSRKPTYNIYHFV